uniref:Eukaryotic translation initiation factor 4G n=1 Tax=Kalanchoe fedtschenkoi TaxID=63787 RepID=A0A7N0UPI3_KALFE
MSGNQSRFDKSDFRKTGRSGNSSGAYQKSYSNKSAGGAGGGFGPPPVSSNRSFKKTNNAPGGQPAVNSQSTVAAPSRTPHTVQHNGVPEQQPVRGPPGTAVSEVESRVYDSSSSQRNNQAVPRAPASQSSTMSSDTKSPMTPVKEDAPKPIAVQFGSISPGFIHGMQIPARTSSAPPNLDEQKRNQARIDSLRTGPSAPVPAIPKQQLLEKEAGVSKQIQVGEPHSVPRIKKESQVSSAPSSSLPQKPPSIPMSGISLQAAFHQQPVHLPYGGPNPPIQPQGLPGASMHMPLPMHYPMASAPQLQHQMYMPNIQPHPMQHQGMMHQGQGMIFPAQMGPHMSHQLGNVGMNMHPQYTPQQAGKFATARKPVVITHPETREELKLDKRGDKHGDGGLPGPRPHSNVPANSQTIQSYTSGPSPNFYPNSFSNSPFSVHASSLYATSAQGTPSTHAPRFNPGSQNPHASGFGSSPASSKVTISVSVPSELVKSERGNVTQVAGSAVPASRKASAGSSNVSGQSLGTVAVKAELPKLGGQGDTKQKLSGVESDKASRILIQDLKSSCDVSTVPVSPVAAGTIQDSAPVKSNVEGTRFESTKKPLMKLEEKGSKQDQPQGGALSASTPSPSGIVNHIKSSGTDTEENVDSKSDIISSKTSHEKSTYHMELSLNGRTTTHGSSGSDEVNGRKQLSRSVDDEIEQKIELPTHAATHGEKKGPADCCTNAGTDATNYGLSRTESEHSSVDNVEIRESLDKPTYETAVSSDSPNVNSVSHEFSPCSDTGYHLNAVLSTDPEDVMNDAMLDRDLTLRNCGGDDKNVGDVAPFSVTGFKDKMLPDQNKLKSSSSKGKTKRKESLQKADAAGTSSDLYMAYKAPEEHKENSPSVQPAKTGTFMNEMKKTPGGTVTEGSDTREGGARSKGEPDDWEDAADAATPKVEGPDNSEQKLIQHESENFTKKYSKDFLLKFQAQYCDLPEGFSIAPNVANVLLFLNANKGHNDRDSYPSPGRHPGGSRPDRHGPVVDDDKWSKVQVHVVHNRDHVNGAGGFRPVQGGNFGVLRNPRQAPGHFPGVNHSGPTQSINAMIRNNNEADRWQRGSNFQKGLIPSPQTPSQLMHKAEKKYEIGKVADEEQAKQRRLKGILNKLTPQNFEKLFEQVKAVNIDSAVTLTGVISQIFDKALMEPTFCEMYADFCYHLSGELPDFGGENEKITFKRVLLNKCQEEFERGEREQEEANRSEDSEMTQTKEEREERRVQARGRMLGNIRLIGELFKKKMLTEKIMHECIRKLLGQHQNPDEEDIEALCKLMSTIGEMIDHPVAKPHMDAYFDRMDMLSVDMNLSSRVRFMLKDAIDLRKNKWQQRRKVEGPKKIEEVHRDAAHERQAQANRARGPGINASGRRGPPPEFGSRGSNTVSSPSSHSGNFRGYPSHSRGFGNQDIRSEDRQPSFESRTLSVPLRTVRDDTMITLGPQGGLARGMSSRGSASPANTLPIDRPLSSGESRRREAVGYNGNNSVTERPTSSSSEDAVGRSAPERYAFLASHDKHGEQDRDFHSDRESRNAGSSSEKTSTSSGKALPVELLQDKSLAAIKEFYSAKDEKEVTLCISELNSPSFYPSMIALWVTDSFERKDMHRDLLTRLLINLSKPPSGILSQQDLLKGFESVLETLEDAVNDAPKAPEFLGHILGKSIVENVVLLVDISRVLHEGGEEPGTLLESGLAGDVLGIILEVIQSEKGDSVMNQILSSANLHLEDFRPPGPMKSKKLDKFINVGMTYDG